MSPHLQVWKWGPHMLVSILHRMLGVGMALVGAPLLTWGLAAAATGEDSWRTFHDVFTTDAGNLNLIGWVIAVGLTWAVLQHMMNGIRHLVMDVGAGFELRRNKMSSLATMVASALLTVLYWTYIVVSR